MQDIRKPYTRSRSSEDLQTRLERFQSGSRFEEDDTSVRIPVRGVKSLSSRDTRESNDYEDDWQSPSSSSSFFDNKNISRKKLSPSRGGGKRKLSKIIFSTGIPLVVIAFLFAYTYIFNSATLLITPKNKDIEAFSKVVTFTKDASTKDTVSFTTESRTLSRSKTLTLSESKKVETKASGKITIYNNYDENPQRLIKNTRFESPNGLIYRIGESVVVPGKQSGTPGQIEVTVTAESSGPSFNLTEGRLSVPGFKGSDRFEGFYATVSSPIKGGSSGNKSIVSLPDINAAKDSLSIELERDIKKELVTLSKDGYIRMDDTIQIVFSDNQETLTKEGGEVYTITVTGYIMFAETTSLAKIFAQTLPDYDNDNVTLRQVETLDFTRRESNSLLNATSLPILIEGKPQVVWRLDEDLIINSILGKSTNDFKTIMKNFKAVDSAEIDFSPLWVSSFPSTRDKITIKEKLLNK
ncbi:MAG: hypothetical protein RI935_66 [Candidatus Parcubacteria bacterium]|jgi:hypothetical protein